MFCCFRNKVNYKLKLSFQREYIRKTSFYSINNERMSEVYPSLRGGLLIGAIGLTINQI